LNHPVEEKNRLERKLPLYNPKRQVIQIPSSRGRIFPGNSMSMHKNLLQITDIPKADLPRIVKRAENLKNGDVRSRLLQDTSWTLLFEKASTRTRISFEVAVSHLGGQTIFMTPAESQLGRQEPLRDTARVLSRYVQGMIVRTFSQSNLDELARFSNIPVINALTDLFHPCQVMSDLLTISERTPNLESLRIAWVGDGNNMAHSWINLAGSLPFHLNIATPPGFEPKEEIVARAREAGASVQIGNDPEEAVHEADYVNTDVWASMGQETEEATRLKQFEPFRIDTRLMGLAREGARFMHCLPAHRGQEVTDEVLEGPQSIVWDQAENRLHMQKALLEWVVGSA
jgi:ornithine carbamoyltransferase